MRSVCGLNDQSSLEEREGGEEKAGECLGEEGREQRGPYGTGLGVEWGGERGEERRDEGGEETGEKVVDVFHQEGKCQT